MKVSPRRVAVLLLLVIAVIVGLVWFKYHHAPEKKLLLYGNVDIRETDLAFRQSGRLETLFEDEGARVNAGQLLAVLDDVPFKEAVAGAQAKVAEAHAQLRKLYHGNRPQQIAEASAAVRQAQASADNARADAARQRHLLDSGASSQRIVDAALAASRAADANLAAARQQLNLMLAGSRQEDIDAGVAEVAAAEAALAQAKTALADTHLLAPVDGIVLSRVREPGSMINPSTPVYILTALSPVYVRAYAPETELGQMVPGKVVKVMTDSSTQAYDGTIGFVSPEAEFTPKSVETTDLRTDLVYRIRVTVNRPDEHLRQGMPVTVMVPR